MKKLFKQFMVLAFASAFAAPASAVSFGDGGTGLQSVLDGITTDPVGDSSINVATDEMNDGIDSYWAVGGSGGVISTVIVELAGFAGSNTFGVYDRTNSNTSVELFSGAATTGSQVTLGILADGSVLVNFVDTGVNFLSGNDFGFYLDSSANNGGGTWYSDTSLNSDGTDHMAAYQGVGDEVQIGAFAPGIWTPNEYVLAWEDLDCNTGCDADFTDFVVMVESVTPTPEPVTLSLLGLGLVGMGFARRRRNV